MFVILYITNCKVVNIIANWNKLRVCKHDNYKINTYVKIDYNKHKSLKTLKKETSFVHTK